MYLPFVLKFYEFRMVVKVKMCGIETVNGSVGMDWGFGNEFPGPEFNLGTPNLLPRRGLRRPRCEPEHPPPTTAEDKNGWI